MMLNKVSLNTIGLNRIGLNRIGKPSRASSDRPYIDPEVLASLKAVCICYGKSNDDPDRAVVKNLVDPDNPFVISNAAFKLNSGFGKYEVDFTVYNNQNVLVSPNKIVSIAGRQLISLLPYTELSKTISSYKIKVTGLIGELSYWYRNQDGSESRIIITKDGIYQLSTCYNVENGQGSSVGFNGYSESSCTIEQIPSFEGAFVADGVDDHITIPTLSSGGKQVLMKVNWNTIDSIIYDQRGSGGFAICCSDYNTIGDSITVPAYKGRNANGTTYIDGIRNEYIIASQLRNVTHNIVEILDASYAAGNINPIIGKSYMNANYGSLALYDFMLFDNISTDDKIKELNEYVGIEAKVELPPYYWDAYGKTNLDADKATIQQRGVAVGDYDLTNNNFAYDKMSGFGGYEFAKFDNTSEWIFTNNSDTIEVVNRDGYTVVLRKVGNGTNYWHFRNTVIKSLGQDIRIGVYANKSVQIVWQLKYKLEGDTDYNTLAIASPTIEGNINTYVTLPYKTEQEIADLNAIDTYYSIYFIPIDLNIDEEVTIEMLPLYPNGLVYDGITDYSENANIPAFTEFSYVFKRKLLSESTGSASMNKGLTDQQRAVVVDHINANGNIEGTSFGTVIPVSSLRDSDIIYSTTNNINGTTVSKGSKPDSNGIDIGRFVTWYKQMVFYKLMLYPKTIPLLQINFLKNLMEKDEIIDLNNPIFIQE